MTDADKEARLAAIDRVIDWRVRDTMYNDLIGELAAALRASIAELEAARAERDKLAAMVAQLNNDVDRASMAIGRCSDCGIDKCSPLCQICWDKYRQDDY